MFDYKITLIGTGNRSFIDRANVINYWFHYSILYFMGIEAAAFTLFVTSLLCFAFNNAYRVYKITKIKIIMIIM